MIDTTRTAAITLTYPDNCCRPELEHWFERIGITIDRRFYINEGSYDVCTAYNRTILDALTVLPKEINTFIFAERDVVPSLNNTAEFLQHKGEVVGAIYETAGEKAFDSPQSFHTGLWRASRRALMALEPPWFALPKSPDGTELLCCPCAYLQWKFNEAGIRTAHAGWVAHTPKYDHIG